MSQTFRVSVPQLQHEQLLKTTDEQYSQALASFAKQLKTQNRYLMVDGGNLIYDFNTRLLWQGKPDFNTNWNYSKPEAEDGHRYIRQDKFFTDHSVFTGLIRKPTKSELINVATNNFPLREGSNYRLKNVDYWMVLEGRIDLDNSDPSPDPSQSGRLIGVVDLGKLVGTTTLKSGVQLSDPTKGGWFGKLVSIFGNRTANCSDIHFLIQQGFDFHPYGSKNLTESQQEQLDALDELDTANNDLASIWANIDWTSTRLPALDPRRFYDQDQGMWEFSPSTLGPRLDIDSNKHIHDRHPSLDIRHGNVAIDFGTSSTVVAFREHGRDQLLRIGVKDFFAAPRAQDYENPTVLEFVHYANMLHNWQSIAYRPLLNWDDVRCSHEAKLSLNKNLDNEKRIGSIFSRLKQWALRDANAKPQSITDHSEQKYLISPLAERNPIKGQPLPVGTDYDFDPIELYAWFLGMNINWRQRGIFLHYYMSFPVAYPVAVKQKILASFRRGLQRSLPDALIEHAKFKDFRVEERASEPAAFAAAALDAYGIHPSTHGESYAVFDFGGGTTDFDYGVYREPSAAEEDLGWEAVLEHFGAAGDKFLGGENLIENLAYLVFKNNVEECRNKRIPFTKPLDALAFTGSEVLLDNTQSAQSNTTMLMAKLRPVWENNSAELGGDGKIKMNLFNSSSELVACELNFDLTALQNWLEERIFAGVKDFFMTMKKSFDSQKRQPEQIHILLGGNSSRSNIVRGFFGLDPDNTAMAERSIALLEQLYGGAAPETLVHPLLEAEDENNPHAPTTKTAVALGLLRICPNEPILVINHTEQANDDSPFQFTVGTFKKGKFAPAILRNATYEQWQELGIIREGLFTLQYSSVASAELGDMQRGHAALKEKLIAFAHSKTGDRAYAKVVSPTSIVLCAATSADELAHATHMVEEQLTH